MKDIEAGGGAHFDSKNNYVFPLEKENEKPIHLKVHEAKLIEIITSKNKDWHPSLLNI